MNKNIAIILLSLAVGILLVFLLLPEKQHDTNQGDYDLAKADNKILIEQRNAGLKKIDSLEFSGRGKDSSIARLKADKAVAQKELDKNIATANRLSKEVKELRKNDTTEFGRKCDSLADKLESITFLYTQYKDYSDSLTVKIEQQKVDYETALNEQKRLYNDLYTKYEQLYRLYDQLFKDYSSARKSLRREKLKTKVAAVLALVATGLFIAK